MYPARHRLHATTWRSQPLSTEGGSALAVLGWYQEGWRLRVVPRKLCAQVLLGAQDGRSAPAVRQCGGHGQAKRQPRRASTERKSRLAGAASRAGHRCLVPRTHRHNQTRVRDQGSVLVGSRELCAFFHAVAEQRRPCAPAATSRVVLNDVRAVACLLACVMCVRANRRGAAGMEAG
jgi:hypothetical protein